MDSSPESTGNYRWRNKQLECNTEAPWHGSPVHFQPPSYRWPTYAQPAVSQPNAAPPSNTLRFVVIAAEDLKKAPEAKKQVKHIVSKGNEPGQVNLPPIWLLLTATICSSRFSSLAYHLPMKRLPPIIVPRAFPSLGTDQPSRPITVVFQQSDTITLSGMAWYQEGHWLSDDSINYFFKRIIQPLSENIHFFDSYFFIQLLH